MNRPATPVSSRSHLRIATLVLMLGAAPACHAYIDPNTGGFIYQLLFPLIVAVAAGWRWVKMGVVSIWHRLAGKIGAGPGDVTQDREDDTMEDR